MEADYRGSEGTILKLRLGLRGDTVTNYSDPLITTPQIVPSLGSEGCRVRV